VTEQAYEDKCGLDSGIGDTEGLIEQITGVRSVGGHGSSG
jgi:hypothetical protein